MTSRTALLTTNEVADECKVTAETVRVWVRDGRLAAITLPGGSKRFRREDVDRLLTPTEPTTAGAA
jgi:excisionase family DNA binding protein